MEEEISFILNYAKSNRSKCINCKVIIPKGDIRIGKVYPSHKGDWSETQWFHVSCFKVPNKLGSYSKLFGFDFLKSEDQLLVRTEIGKYAGKIEGKYLIRRKLTDFKTIK
jgi:hypothetical protein